MFWLLIVFAVEELRGIVEADNYYSEDFVHEEVVEVGGFQNHVHIKEVCVSSDAVYLVGGGVRVGDSFGGLDGVIIKYSDRVEWIKSYGGSRDDEFLGCTYLDNLHVSGNTLSLDYLGKSSNFKTGFYVVLNNDGVVLQEYVFDYQLDIYPEVIWYDQGLHLAGYLDDFGDYDLFFYNDNLSIVHHSGQDRIYAKDDENFYGSTTSKELGAMNLNPMVYGDNINVIYSSLKGELLGEYGYLGEDYINQYGEVVEEVFLYQDETLTIKNTEDSVVITESMLIETEFESEEKHTFLRDNILYEYSVKRIKDIVYYGNVVEVMRLTNNIQKDTYYNSFRLLFSGSGLLNGELIESGELLMEGNYVFEQGTNIYQFQVVKNEIDLLLLESDFVDRKHEEPKGINRKIVYIPLIIVGNILYKKYQ